MDLVGNTQLTIGQSAGNFSKKMIYKKNGNENQNTKIICLPKETLSHDLLESLRTINNLKKHKKKSFSWYRAEIAKLFGIKGEHPFGMLDQVSDKKQKRGYKSVKYKTFYGGFVVGEGSINVSAKKSVNALFGILIDPEFSVTQHVNGFGFLFAALCLFDTGSIHYKSGSNATLVYRIDNRKSLLEKVIPFWETFICPYQSTEENRRVILFKRILFFLEEKKHKDYIFFVDQILPLWDKLRKQKGQINESFPNYEAAKNFVVEVEKKKRKGSSETTRDLIII